MCPLKCPTTQKGGCHMIYASLWLSPFWGQWNYAIEFPASSQCHTATEMTAWWNPDHIMPEPELQTSLLTGLLSYRISSNRKRGYSTEGRLMHQRQRKSLFSGVGCLCMKRNHKIMLISFLSCHDSVFFLFCFNICVIVLSHYIWGIILLD